MAQPIIEDRFGKIKSIDDVANCFEDGSTVMFGGFGGVGSPPLIIETILKKGVKDLYLIGNDAGFPWIGVGKLVSANRVKKLIASHIGSNPVAGQLMNEGKMEIEFSPQGILVERIRAGGVGLGGVLSDIGFGTVIEDGKKIITLNGDKYMLETPLRAEIGIIKAHQADPYGNLTYKASARNTNPLVAKACDLTIVQADEIVPLGELDPESVITPGVYVDMMITGKGGEWLWPWEIEEEN